MTCLKDIVKLNFEGKAEAFVEQKFLTPLLKKLGYDEHKDYEVKRHGDDGTNFKLTYPPVENGAKKVKNYNPDYIPTIRKKCFWIIEAKSPKDVTYPFDDKYITQGLQYCIHPEIQAKYLVLSNGKNTAIYDAFTKIYYGENIYNPIFEFTNNEIIDKWEKIYNLLSAEKIRQFIENDLKKMYEKVASSSLDKEYPNTLIKKIGENAMDISKNIEKHVSKLYFEKLEEKRKNRIEIIENMQTDYLYNYLMDYPLTAKKTVGEYIVERFISEGKSKENIYQELISTYENACIFRKQNIFCALCKLYNVSEDDEIRQKIIKFLKNNKDKELPLINKVECTYLAVMRKLCVIMIYPVLKTKIEKFLKVSPEINRYVDPPTTLKESYDFEIEQHYILFHYSLKYKDKEQLIESLEKAKKLEKKIQSNFDCAYYKIPQEEKEIGGGFLNYETGYKSIFNNILKNFGINI